MIILGLYKSLFLGKIKVNEIQEFEFEESRRVCISLARGDRIEWVNFDEIIGLYYFMCTCLWQITLQFSHKGINSIFNTSLSAINWSHKMPIFSN